MICPKCRTVLPEHAKYCYNCGTAVTEKQVQKKSHHKTGLILVLLIILGSFISNAGSNLLALFSDLPLKDGAGKREQLVELMDAPEDAALETQYDQVFSDRGLWDSSNIDSCLDRIAYIRILDDDGTEEIEKIEFGHRDGRVIELECSFYCSTADMMPDEIGDFMGGERVFYETTYGEVDNAIVRSTHVMNYGIVQITYKELDKSNNAKAVMSTLECYGPGISDAARGADYIPVPSTSDYPGWYIKQTAGN